MQMKKILALMMAVALTFTLAACSGTGSNTETAADGTGTAEETTEGSTDAAASEDIVTTDNSNAQPYSGDLEPVKIGFICWGYTDSLSQGYQRALDFAGEYCGFEVEYVATTKYEEHVNYAENLIQAGCQIIMTTKASTALMDVCDQNQVYLAQWGSPIDDPELADYLAQSEYWVGCSTVDDYDAGYQCVEALYEQGCRNIVLIGTGAGNYCHDLRFSGMYDAVATHDDLNVLGEFRSSSLATEGAPALQNFIALYPEMDGVVASGATNGTLEMVIQTLDTEGKIGDIKFATLDIQDGCDTYLEEGSLSFIGGGQYLEAMFLAIDAVNVFDGAYPGNNQLDTTFIYLQNAEDYADYTTYIDGEGIYPYSAEELQSVTYRCNPDATFDDLYNMWNSYSMDYIKEKNS